jgi:hypothetical protein
MALDFDCILHKIPFLLTGFVENSSCKIYNEYEISYAFVLSIQEEGYVCIKTFNKKF